MPIIPTQLIEFNDGTNTKGFTTMYDLKPLNYALVVAGAITGLAAAAPAAGVGFPSPVAGDRLPL